MDSTPDARHVYFAYGSNLNRVEMDIRCPAAKPLVPAELREWQLAFRGVADIEPALGSSVPGALWVLTDADVDSLDVYEGAPTFYRRLAVTVETDTGPREAMTYVMTGQSYLGLPSESYYGRIVAGYRDWELPLAELGRALRETRSSPRRAGRWRFRPDGTKRLRAVRGEATALATESA